MVLIIIWTIKRKGSYIIKFTSQYQQMNLLKWPKIEYGLDEGYNSDGEPWTFYDVKDLEYNQHFYVDDIPDVLPLGDGENDADDEGNEYVLKGGDKSNKNSSPPVYIDILEYQVQKVNVNQLKYKLRKILKPLYDIKLFMKDF